MPFLAKARLGSRTRKSPTPRVAIFQWPNWPNWQNLSAAYGSSLLLHLVIGLNLALIVLPSLLKPWREDVVYVLDGPESTVISDAFDEVPGPLANAVAPAVDAKNGDPERRELGSREMGWPIDGIQKFLGNSAETDVGPEEIQPKFKGVTTKDLGPNAKTKLSGKRLPVSKLVRTAQDGKRFNNPLLKTAEEGLVIASSPGAACDGVFSQLEGAGHGAGGGGGDAREQWHIWLLDASISLQLERQKLGNDVSEFYQKLSKKDGDVRFNVSVVAFGQRSQSLLDKTSLSRASAPKTIGALIKDLPIDETGIENVMTAIMDSLRLVPQDYKGKISVVIWTDESGDDIERLEEIIAQCQKTNVTIHVVGPRSVFGMQSGLQRHTLDPPLSWELILPVTRGPDSAFPERVRLPLWYDSTDMPWSAGIPISTAIDAASLGGPLRCGLLSPTGPYALTRLSLATRGTYTILDRHGDQPPPNAQGLLKYAPDYRGAAEIIADLEDHPLRRAVVESAALTWSQDFWPPQREFPVSRNTHYPFIPLTVVMNPFRFIQVMGERVGQDRTRLAEAANTLERAIGLLDSVPPEEKSREKDSPRWTAWYTLNRGLLLAHSVRIGEFLRVTEPLLAAETQLEIMNNNFNYMLLDESNHLVSGGAAVRRATLARTLLEQVIREHPDTPWSQLAKWELQHQLGFTIVYRQLPIPQKVYVPQPAPNPTLPNL